MQLLCDYSEENDTKCLGVFENVKVRRFITTSSSFKIPQVGWNTITDLKGKLFSSIKENTYCYFVHSYYAEANSFSVAAPNVNGALLTGSDDAIQRALQSARDQYLNGEIDKATMWQQWLDVVRSEFPDLVIPEPPQ